MDKPLTDRKSVQEPQSPAHPAGNPKPKPLALAVTGPEPPVFRRIAPPGETELQALVARLAERIGRALERRGVLVRDAESSYFELEPAADGPMADLPGHLITYRVAVGPCAGQKVFSLQTVPAREEGPWKGAAQYAGFSLHGGIGVETDQRGKLERLTRYVSRPPVSFERLDRTAQGQVRYRLKTPYRDGTTHIVLTPLDFIARLAALVSIEAPELIERILAHRRERGGEEAMTVSLGARARPQASLL